MKREEEEEKKKKQNEEEVEDRSETLTFGWAKALFKYGHVFSRNQSKPMNPADAER